MRMGVRMLGRRGGEGKGRGKCEDGCHVSLCNLDLIWFREDESE